MNDEENVFSLPEVVIMLLFTVPADALNILAILGAIIPVVGQVLLGFSWLVNVGVSALILIWFIMKIGASSGQATKAVAGQAAKRGLGTIIGGGVAKTFGLPILTITTLVGVYMANHPKIVAVATTVAGKGAIGALGKEAGAAKGVATKTEVGTTQATRVEAGAVGAQGVPQTWQQNVNEGLGATASGYDESSSEGAGRSPEEIKSKAREQEVEKAMTPKFGGSPEEAIKEEMPEVFISNEPMDISKLRKPEVHLNNDKNEVDLKKAA
jgi:hypothetical protein